MPITLTEPAVRSSWITAAPGESSFTPGSDPGVNKLGATSPINPDLSAAGGPSKLFGLRRALPATALIGVCAAAAFTEVSAEEGQVLCPYRLATGGWCPGCGCTRALKALMHGDFRGSMLLNPFMLLVLIQATIISGFFLLMPTKAQAWWRKNDFLVAKVNMAAAGIIWAARLAAGTIPLPF